MSISQPADNFGRLTFVQLLRLCSIWSRTGAARVIRVSASGARLTLRRALKVTLSRASGAFGYAVDASYGGAEIVGLRWSDLDLDKGVLHVRHQTEVPSAWITCPSEPTRYAPH